jgi:UDP-glucose 4-epimerase
MDVPDALVGDTVVITGGAGFVGSHLAEALVGETEVRILDDLSTGSADRVPEEAVLVRGDVRDEGTVAAAVEGADVVFHEAANASVQRSIAAPRESHDINVGGAVTVLEAARAADARVVSASSTAIYGPPERVPIEESDPKRPQSPYGVEKLALDRDTLVYNDLYGLPTVSLRYFNVYGARQGAGDYSGVIDVFLDQARRGDPITVDGDGSQTRDFVHVRDVVQANLRAAVTDSVGTAFNVGTGESVSIEALAETVRAVTGSSSRLTYTDPRPGDIQHSRADISNARAELGYEPTVDLEAGLEALVG